MRKHIVDKHPKCIQPKKCKMCEKTFTKNVELERHIKIHHEAEPFECEKCGKTFVLKWRLRKHLSVHETRIYCQYLIKIRNASLRKLDVNSNTTFLHLVNQKGATIYSASIDIVIVQCHSCKKQMFFTKKILSSLQLQKGKGYRVKSVMRNPNVKNAMLTGTYKNFKKIT